MNLPPAQQQKPPKVGGAESQTPKRPEGKEGIMTRAMGWIKGTFWGGPSLKKEIDVALPQTGLNGREMEKGEREAVRADKGGKKSGFFKSVLEGVGSIFGLNREEKELQSEILSSINDPESLLGLAIADNTNEIVINTSKYFREKIRQEQAQELGKMQSQSFQDVVIESNEKEFNLILDLIEKEIEAGTFPELDKTTFNRALFEKDPLSFMVKALANNREKTDLYFVVDYLSNKNEAFREAFGKLKLETETYFYELRKAKRDPKDIDYQKAIVRYLQLESLLEAIHEFDEDEWGDLETEFNKSFGEEYEKLQSFLIEKEAQEFEKMMQELANTLFVNDKEYQKARMVIDKHVYLAGDTLDVGQLYFSNPEFRDAYNQINARFKGVEGLLGYRLQSNREENLMSVEDFAKAVAREFAGDTAQYVADHKGRLLLSPAIIIGAAVFGVQVIPAAIAGSAIVNIAKKAVPAMHRVLVESDVLFDFKAAQEDRKVRAPILQHVFLEAPTAEQRKRALDNIIKANLLFREDVEGDSELKAYLIEQKVDLEKLPKFSDYRDSRLQFKRLMREDFPNEELLQGLISELHASNLIYLDDFKGWSDKEISQVLPKGVRKEDLPTLKDAKDIRNPSLFLLKGGVKLTVEQKLGELAKLHKKGILFKEDVARLKDAKVASEEEVNAFLKENKISLDDLPSDQTYYYKTNVTLKQQEDVKREPYLKMLQDSNKSQSDKLLVLKKMHLEGICFLDDLQFPGLDEKTVAQFKEFVKFSPSERRKMHDEAKTGGAILAKHEAVLKSNASEAEKMDSLLELEMEGLLSKEHAKMVGPVIDKRYGHAFLNKPEAMTHELEDAHEHYQVGVYHRLKKLGDVAYEGIKQNPGKIAMGLAFVGGGGWMTIGGVALMGDIAGVIWRKERAVEIVHGPMKEVKGAVDLGIGVVAGVVSDFTDIPAENIHKRIAEQLHVPSERQVKQGAAYIMNKGIGAVKWATLSASIGTFIGGAFGLKVGAAIGSFYGLCVTDGKIDQNPPGGWYRAIKFSAVGALVGSVVPLVMAALVAGLALAGVIGATAGIAVASGGLALIIPLILFGVYAGFQIAGLTGVDVDENADEVVDQIANYEPMNLEKAGVYLV